MDRKNISKLGLIDGIGNADQVLKEKFGEKVIIKNFEKQKDLLQENYLHQFKTLLKNFKYFEEKSMWQKFGL